MKSRATHNNYRTESGIHMKRYSNLFEEELHTGRTKPKISIVFLNDKVDIWKILMTLGRSLLKSKPEKGSNENFKNQVFWGRSKSSNNLSDLNLINYFCWSEEVKEDILQSINSKKLKKMSHVQFFEIAQE